MISYITSKASQYYNQTSSIIKNFIDKHPSLTRAAALTAATLAGYAIEHYARQLALTPSGCQLEPGGCFPRIGDEKYYCSHGILQCSGSLFESFVDGVKSAVHEMPSLAVAGGIGMHGLSRLGKAAISKWDNFVFPLVEKTRGLIALSYNRLPNFDQLVVTSVSSKKASQESPWAKFAKGFTYYPFARLAGHASALIGCIANSVRPEVVRPLLTQSIPIHQIVPVLFSVNLMVAPEEFLFRKILQDQVMKKGVSATLKRYSPALAKKSRNHRVAKAARIVLSSAIFSLAHLVGTTDAEKDAAAYQLANTFGAGLIFGHLQETAGTWAAIGAHSSLNTLTYMSTFKYMPR